MQRKYHTRPKCQLVRYRLRCTITFPWRFAVFHLPSIDVKPDVRSSLGQAAVFGSVRRKFGPWQCRKGQARPRCRSRLESTWRHDKILSAKIDVFVLAPRSGSIFRSRARCKFAGK